MTVPAGNSLDGNEERREDHRDQESADIEDRTHYHYAENGRRDNRQNHRQRQTNAPSSLRTLWSAKTA